MTLTKNVLTRIIKEELAKIVNEQRSPRSPRRINESPDMVNMLHNAAFVKMLADNLSNTDVFIQFMSAVAAAAGIGSGAVAAVSKRMTDEQTFGGGDDEPMQEAKKKATSTGNAAKMGFGTKSKMASHKFSPLKTKK